MTRSLQAIGVVSIFAVVGLLSSCATSDKVVLDAKAQQTFSEILKPPIEASRELQQPVWVFCGIDDDHDWFIFIRADVEQKVMLPKLLTQLKNDPKSVPDVRHLNPNHLIAELPCTEYDSIMANPPRCFRAIYSPIGLPEDLNPDDTRTRTGWQILDEEGRLWVAPS